jgi:cysteine desulfurase
MHAESVRVGRLRDRLERRLLSELDGITRNGPREGRLPGNLNLSFSGVDASALLLSLPELALSTGSACSSATAGPSHVLLALGLSDERARSAIRFGLGRYTTREEVDFAASRIIEVVQKLRGLSPVPARA